MPGLSILSPEFLYFEKRSARLAAGISSSPWAVSSSPFHSLYSRPSIRRPDGSPGDGPVLDAGALVLGVFCWVRAVRSSYQSYGEEVRTLVVHPARIDVLSICLHDAYTESARGSQKSIRVGLRAKRSLFCRRRMGSRWAHRHSDCCDLFCRRIFSSSRVCARLSFGKDHAIVGSISQRMGIPHRSDPTGRWNRLGPDQKSRMAAISIGALMTVLTLFLCLPIWILAHGGTTPAIMEAINYVFDTLLYAGAALVLASALPCDSDGVEKTSGERSRPFRAIV
jgi:hypothetical protein